MTSTTVTTSTHENIIGHVPDASIANGHTLLVQTQVFAPPTTGAPGEYTPSPDEQRIIDFLNVGIDELGRSIQRVLSRGKWGSASDFNHEMNSLVKVRDLIANGHHAAVHPTRDINPEGEARYGLGHKA